MRLLLAPVTITPTKALTPSHLKGLLWVDVLFRATAQIADVTYLWNCRTDNLTAQTLGFWAHLDDAFAGADYADWTELDIAREYVRFHATGPRPAAERLDAHRDAVERTGWMHPASRRLLELWGAHFRLLRLHDPGIAANQRPAMSVEAVVEHLAEHGLCLDHRRFGGPLYLDTTDAGAPLRPVITPDGHANYLISALRNLLPVMHEYDRVVFVYDGELEHDYVLLARILDASGVRTTRIRMGRVPIDGAVQSSRMGGWEAYTVDALAAMCLREFEPAAFALGLRLYFIATLQRESGSSFDLRLLHRSLVRAARIVAAGLPAASDDDIRDFLRGMTAWGGYVDPYRLTVSLLSRRTAAPVGGLLDAVYL